MSPYVMNLMKAFLPQNPEGQPAAWMSGVAAMSPPALAERQRSHPLFGPLYGPPPSPTADTVPPPVPATEAALPSPYQALGRSGMFASYDAAPESSDLPRVEIPNEAPIPTVDVTGAPNQTTVPGSFDWRKVLSAVKPMALGSGQSQQQMPQAHSPSLGGLKSIPPEYLLPLLQMLQGKH